MLRTRLWMGSVLIALALGVLVLDQGLYPYCPCLLGLLMLVAPAAAFELLQLLPPTWRPPTWLAVASVAGMVVANWLPLLGSPAAGGREAWFWIAGVFALVILSGFLVEMAGFREPGNAVQRMAVLGWMTAYLGFLASFFAQLRWQHGSGNLGTVALALAIFVPKGCDIGAYFTGRLLGRHPMAPVLSPKKTWEGAAGGMVLSVLVAVGLNALGPVIQGTGRTMLFGFAVGLAGLAGDLAESLIKRDLRHKDASQAVPGFGGILDVVDSVLFAAPVAYFLLALE